MTNLNKFREPITVAGESLGKEYTAYKMDNTGEMNMRAVVKLPSCHCCDYFLPMDDAIVLIEETRLRDKVEGIKAEHGHLNLSDNDMDNLVHSHIKIRMQLKAYGAMLVLCRLAAKCADAKMLFHEKNFHFWLVASNIEMDKEEKHFDNLEDTLRKTLRQVLGVIKPNGVEVLSSDALKARLSSQ